MNLPKEQIQMLLDGFPVKIIQNVKPSDMWPTQITDDGFGFIAERGKKRTRIRWEVGKEITISPYGLPSLVKDGEFITKQRWAAIKKLATWRKTTARKIVVEKGYKRFIATISEIRRKDDKWIILLRTDMD